MVALSWPLIIHVGNDKLSGTHAMHQDLLEKKKKDLLGGGKNRHSLHFLTSPLFTGTTVTQGVVVFMLERRSCNSIHWEDEKQKKATVCCVNGWLSQATLH